MKMQEKFEMKKHSLKFYKLVFLGGNNKEDIEVRIDRLQYSKGSHYVGINWENEGQTTLRFLEYKNVEIYEGLETFDEPDDVGVVVYLRPYGRFEVTEYMRSGMHITDRKIRPRYRIRTIPDQRNVKI